MKWAAGQSLLQAPASAPLWAALYASGIPGKAIREYIQKVMVSRQDSWRDILKKRSDLLKLVRIVDWEHGRAGSSSLTDS